MNRLLNLICALETSDRDVDIILSALAGLRAHVTPTLIITPRHQQLHRQMAHLCGMFSS